MTNLNEKDVIHANPSNPSVASIVAVLSTCIRPHRLARLQRIIANRISNVEVVLENLVDPHNAAACLRTCDGMGLNRVHFIERYSTAAPPEYTKWLSIERHSRTSTCLLSLRERGFRIVATDLSEQAIAIEDIDPPIVQGDRVAIVMGNEERGISNFARRESHHLVRLPMRGFVQSYNISVATAMMLTQLDARGILCGHMTHDQQQDLLATFLLRDVRGARQILESQGVMVDDY